MKVLGIRYCSVSPDSSSLATFFDALGLSRKDLSEFGIGDEPFSGAVFPAGESWIELWPQGPEMPTSAMLQIGVDNSEEFAENARANGLRPQGPMNAHGERIYMLQAPSIGR